MLRVADDGKGFDPNQVSAGFGLGTMRERAEAIGATIHIHSEIGRGTEMALTWSNSAAAL